MNSLPLPSSRPSVLKSPPLAQMWTDRTWQETQACPLVFSSTTINLNWNIILRKSQRTTLNPYACRFWGNEGFIFLYSIYLHLTWPRFDKTRITHYLANRLHFYQSFSEAGGFIWLPAGCWAYLHIWQAVLCLLATCVVLGILYWLALRPCFSVIFLRVLCLPAFISTSLPTCLFGSVSAHPPRQTPDNATRARNRKLQTVF